MNVEEIRLCLLLHSVFGIDSPILSRVLVQSGCPQALADAGSRRWQEMAISGALQRELALTIAGKKGSRSVDIDGQLAALQKAGAHIIPITDSRYPPLLRAIHDPPPLLYVRGNAALLSQAQLAVVGSRRASAAGLRSAADLAGQAALAGLHITSGLALGIDGSAHRGALDAEGISIAVVATGIDRVYPARHRGLALEIEKGGCLVSEFPPGVPPLAHNFPRRNRIISGLSLGVLVVEAALRSGSLITARTAMEQGREVFALPWSICHTGGAGCLRLLRDGAKMVEHIHDILEELGPLFTLQQELLCEVDEGQGLVPDLSDAQQRVLQLLGYELVTADEVSQLSALSVAQVMAELSFLEMQGLVRREAGGYIRS